MNKPKPVTSFMALPARTFSDAPAVQAEEGENQVETQESLNARVGADETFSERKHAYVLTFPWNFPQIVDRYTSEYPGITEKSGDSEAFWRLYVENSGCLFDFNKLFREFHQACALPDVEGLHYCCEGRLATAVGASVERIHFHGLDIEMANLTVEQPMINVLKVEIAHGLSLQRDANGSKDRFEVSEGTTLGAPTTYYTPTEEHDTRHWLDFLDSKSKPYCISVTAMIESPMKLYVQNQNYSRILFGSTDE